MSTLTGREMLTNFALSTFIGKATKILFSNCNCYLLFSGIIRDRNLGPGINHKQMAKCFVCRTGDWIKGPVWTNQALYHYFGDKTTFFLLILAWGCHSNENLTSCFGRTETKGGRPRLADVHRRRKIGVRRWVWVFGPLLGFQMPSYIQCRLSMFRTTSWSESKCWSLKFIHFHILKSTCCYRLAEATSNRPLWYKYYLELGYFKNNQTVRMSCTLCIKRKGACSSSQGLEQLPCKGYLPTPWQRKFFVTKAQAGKAQEKSAHGINSDLLLIGIPCSTCCISVQFCDYLGPHFPEDPNTCKNLYTFVLFVYFMSV